jgi:hypothetical protein
MRAVRVSTKRLSEFAGLCYMGLTVVLAVVYCCVVWIGNAAFQQLYHISRHH